MALLQFTNMGFMALFLSIFVESRSLLSRRVKRRLHPLERVGHRLTLAFLAISPGPDQPPVSIRFLGRPAHWVHPLLWCDIPSLAGDARSWSRHWGRACRKVGHTSPIDQGEICAARVSVSYCTGAKFAPGNSCLSTWYRHRQPPSTGGFGGRVLFALVKGFLTRQQRLTRKLANPLDMGWYGPARQCFWRQDQFGQAEIQSGDPAGLIHRQL